MALDRSTSALSALLPALTLRAGGRCELCAREGELSPRSVPPAEPATADRSILLCADCDAGVDAPEGRPAARWSPLSEAIWSEVPAVKVQAWRLLSALSGEAWAAAALEAAYLDEDTLAWAEAGAREAPEAAEAEATARDSNGAVLREGDSVTLIKDLPVKGGGFTAKRGTLVKGIHLIGDPDHVEGSVNKIQIVLKTAFLKRVS